MAPFAGSHPQVPSVPTTQLIKFIVLAHVVIAIQFDPFVVQRGEKN